MTASMPIMTTGDAIRKLRGTKALTQEDLAARAGLGVASIYRAESGHSVSAETLASIAAAFDVDVGALSGAEPQDDQPYLLLDPFSGGRALVDVLRNAGRLDFDYVELETLDQASEIEAFHAFCSRLIAEGELTSPIARTTRDLEAKAMLARLARSQFVVSGGAFDVQCHEIDDEEGMGIGVCYGQWEERCAVLRIGIGEPVRRAYVLDRLGKYETPLGNAVVYPNLPAPVDWSGIFDETEPEAKG